MRENESLKAEKKERIEMEDVGFWRLFSTDRDRVGFYLYLRLSLCISSQLQRENGVSEEKRELQRNPY